MKWACEEAAAAAAIAAERIWDAAAESREEESDNTEEVLKDNVDTQQAAWEAAERAAAEVLQRNLKLDSSGIPHEESFFEGPVRWTLDGAGGTYTVYADCGRALFRLAFLKETVSVKSSGNAYFFPNSTKIY